MILTCKCLHFRIRVSVILPSDVLFNSLWSQSKKLVLNTKSRICRISEKEDNLVGYMYTQFPGNFRSIRFSSWNFQNFRWTVRFSEFQQLPVFLEIFSTNFHIMILKIWVEWTSKLGDPNFRFLPGIIVIKLNFLLTGILVWMVHFADFVFLLDFFGKRSLEISLPFVPISKFSELEVGWKTLLVLEMPNSEVRQV